jgi:hypothetical protein
VLAVLDLASGEPALAAQPQPVLVGAEPGLAAPAEAAGLPESTFELVQQEVIEYVLIHHRRPERCRIAGIGRRWRGRRGRAVVVRHLRSGAGGKTEQQQAGKRPRKDGCAHDTSTVRNMPISMW